jgi:hypothetical protein
LSLSLHQQKRLRWIRARCLFFQKGLLFCGNRKVPFFLALFATKQEKTFLFKNYFMKLVHEKKLSALRTRQNIFLCLWIIRTIYAHDDAFIPPGAITAGIT